jgi:membrane fusion protein, multidrug efflux system
VQAQIKADEANIQNARVQLGYATIRAPMDAQAGNLLVRAGSAVKARDDTAQMLVLNQIRPIYVSFSVPEQYLNDIQKYQAARSLRVEAFPPGDEKATVTGDLTFLNNTVDPTTGMIQLKATFANNRGLLWPGQFVSVLLTLTTRPDAVVVPSKAIQTGQQGLYVYVMRPDSTVESRVVTVAMRLGPETVIEKGVSPGEKIVTDGQIRLVPGAHVQAKAANGEAKTGAAEATKKP